MNKKDRIVSEAKKFYNAPFCHSGRSTIGIDCAGLIYMSYHRAGIIVPKTDGKDYTVRWFERTKEERLKNVLLKSGFRILLKNELPDKADIVLFCLRGKNYPAHHSGIMLDDKNFIHAKCGWKNKDKRVGFDPLHPSYIKRLDCILRHKDIN